MTLQTKLFQNLCQMISDTNGIGLTDSLELLLRSPRKNSDTAIRSVVSSFLDRLYYTQRRGEDVVDLLDSPVAMALESFFKTFPLRYREEHIHLTGSLDASFVYPRLASLLHSPQKHAAQEILRNLFQITELESEKEVERLLRLTPHDKFDRYLKILQLPAIVLTSKEDHYAAAWHIASRLYHQHNVGRVCLKYTWARARIHPDLPTVTSWDATLGLYEGFSAFKKEHPNFEFVLSPSFRKEAHYLTSAATKEQDISQQIESLLGFLKTYPELTDVVKEVDTVGSEKDLYAKRHFHTMSEGFRKLQYQGFHIRSHHGETFRTLNKGIQAVDNAMNLWRIDTLEHGLSLGINPHYYYHALYERLLYKNENGEPLQRDGQDYDELMDWSLSDITIRDHLINGVPLKAHEKLALTKTKFHYAREVESYQHDVLNRMIDKRVSLTALPSSNKRLTHYFEGYQDHPFSWWEKKGVILKVGTDNDVTLHTNMVREMLILLFSDPTHLKIHKLLRVVTGENRLPLVSHHLWTMKAKSSHPEKASID
ncbi:MAG: hypothetical protein AB8C84_00880 [Oligoflexales bacterium]